METNNQLFYDNKTEVNILRHLLQNPALTFKLEQYSEQIF